MLKNSQPLVLLTIGIPTWNRCEDIKVVIDSILCQLTDEVRSEIEILVSDNASTDATQAVISEYREMHPELFSTHCNPSNIGFSRNVDMLFRYAKGEFVLVLSDDDALETDALQEIISALKKYSDINVMFVQTGEYDERLSRPLNPDTWAKARDNKKAARAISYYSSGIAFYHENRSLCNVCISGNVYRVSAWKSIDMTPGIESGSIQLHAAIQLNAQSSSCVIRRPLIKYRAGANAVRLDGYMAGFPFIYHFDLLKACRDSQHLYPNKIYRSFYLICVRGLFYTLLDVKANAFPINKAYFLIHLQECMDTE